MNSIKTLSRQYRLKREVSVATVLLALNTVGIHAQEAVVAGFGPPLSIVPRAFATETLIFSSELAKVNPRVEQMADISPGIRLRIDIGPIRAYLDQAITDMSFAQRSFRKKTQAALIVPRISVTETLTNNLQLSNVNPQVEQITEISPGILLQMDGGRIRTYIDYAITEIAYAKSSSPRKTQQALNAFGSVEAVENRVFIDFSGFISQEPISAFGVQTLGNTALNSNQAEVSTYRISPSVRGQLGSFADYEARYSRAVTGSDADAASGATTVDAAIKLASGKSLGNMGWTAEIGRQGVSYSAGRPTESDYANVGLIFEVSPHIMVFAKAGREANNFTSVERQAYATNSLGLNWSPSALSSFSLTRSERSFGDAYSLFLEHRSARTIWKFTDVKDISTTPSQSRTVGIGSMYDLLFRQFASVESDPGLRAQMVENYLQTNGISPAVTIYGNFLTSAISLQRRQELSFALLGLRDTITVMASRSDTGRLDTLSTGIDDLMDAGSVHQIGVSIQYAHRLTPDYSLDVLLSRQRTSGSISSQDSSLRALVINVSGKLGKRSSVSFGALRTVADSDTSPYSESALTGNLNMQF